MNERIIEVSQHPAKLSVHMDRLMLESRGEAPLHIPLGEIAVLVLANPQVVLTHAVLSGIARNGGICVVCDASFRPAAMLLPLVSHTLQTERFAAQISAALPVRKRLWRQIVAQKILSQARILEEFHGGDYGLRAMSRRVRSGDRENLEAQAARRYWRRLFADREFRRDPEGTGINALLNYGYAVLRAAAARALCAAGLHPSVGVHHHNRYNPFCLADDLMEPYRPRLDRHVVHLLRQGLHEELTTVVKKRLLEFMAARFQWPGESRNLFDSLLRTAQSLAEVFIGRRTRLALPEW